MTVSKEYLWPDMRTFIRLKFQTYPHTHTVSDIKPELYGHTVHWLASEHKNFSVSGDDLIRFGALYLHLNISW